VVASDDLPGLDGMTLGRLLKSEASTRDIPLVLRHANGGPSSAETGAFYAEVVSSSLDHGALKKKLMRLLKTPPEKMEGSQEALDLPNEFPRVKGARILAAEDEALNRKYLGLMLKKVGSEHVLVEDGEKALQAIQEGDFGVLLMDCGMPVMDGFEATRRIRDLSLSGGGPVVIGVTARTDEEAMEKGRQSGMDAFVTKPMKLEFLCLVIEEELAKREVSSD
jgi:CheY-like chemotaxis protein